MLALAERHKASARATRGETHDDVGVRGDIEEHLRAEGQAGGLLSPDELEGYATEAYRAAGLAHTLEYELPSPLVLLGRLGLSVRAGHPPEGAHAVWQGTTIVVPTIHLAEQREHGGALLHEGGHYLLRRARHTHADVIQLTLCLAAPWATVRAAVRAGALAPEALMLRQRFAPQWLLEWRCEVIARAFNSFEVA